MIPQVSQVYYIAEAIQSGTRIGQLSLEKKVLGLTGIIARLYSLKNMGGRAVAMDENGTVIRYANGTPKPSAEVSLAVQEMEKELAYRCPYMTMAEVQYALESGVKGELDDEPTILSVANYCRWLSIYRHSGARKEAVDAIENKRRIERPENLLPAGDIAERNEQTIKALTKTLYLEVKNNGNFLPEHTDILVAAVYDSLRKAGRMERPTPDEIQDAQEAAAKVAREGEDFNRVVLRTKRILLQRFYIKKLVTI